MVVNRETSGIRITTACSGRRFAPQLIGKTLGGQRLALSPRFAEGE